MKDLISVFSDTIKHCQEIHPVCQTTKYKFSDIQRAPLTGIKDNISVINSDTVSALVDYYQSGKTCVLNMASYQRPGGGVYNGAKAQEECLFRCSNLSSVIGTDHYPLKESEALYTTGAVFFKDVNYDYMQDITCDVVTLPALRLSGVLDTRGNIYHQSRGTEYRDITKNKIRLMLSLAHNMNCKNIILGAWGCGVYGNDPEIISGYFHEVLVSECYSSLFNKVIFAIINDENSVGNNYEIFKNRLDNSYV